MAKKGLPYKEGDWFGVPLRTGGYAVGLVARARRGGKILFGYFFGPRRERLPTAEELNRYSPGEAILHGRFGDLGLLNGEWPVLGQLGAWDRRAWPMPPLARIDEHAGKAWKVTYSEDDPSVVLDESPCDPTSANRFSRDSLMGYGAVEIRLTKLLSSQAPSTVGGSRG